MVYDLLTEHKLDGYYSLDDRPGISQRSVSAHTYEYLDDPEIVAALLTFDDGALCRITTHLPQIHCSACIWLLEHLYQLHEGVHHVSVNFSARKAHITFHRDKISLRQLVELLARIGYPPEINLGDLSGEEQKQDRSLIYKLGLAGFAFGNIMLLSFPEYLGFDKASYLFHIGYINILLATPVLLYAGRDYIQSAWRGIRSGRMNIDLPIALGMITLYTRSVYEILSHSGEGYLDSFAGFIFFLLIGKWFQSFTYRSLDFSRSYKAYFPISATIRSGESWITKSLEKIQPGDHLLIRNQELVPVDGLLQKGRGRIDYSFVTGEAELITKEQNDKIYAGGRHMGESIEMIATKKVDQSYLTQLWNEDAFAEQEESSTTRLIGAISQYFTLVIIAISLVAFAGWSTVGLGKAVEVFTSVLIVACPCALALAIPFTYGNILRLLSKAGFYLRNVGTIEKLQDIDTIIFDKTGTLTDNHDVQLTYDGRPLTTDQLTLIKSACFHSSHPLSKAIVKELQDAPIMDVDQYEDIIGEGIIASVSGHHLRLGSSSFIFGSQRIEKESGVFIEIDGDYVGYYRFEHALRPHTVEMIDQLSQHYSIGLLSGDSERDSARIQRIMPIDQVMIHFNQSPKDKLTAIKDLQNQGRKVMMIGDGLNDAGALRQANVGIVISDEVNNFSPACDGILAADSFHQLMSYLGYFRYARRVIYGAFAIAFLYNAVGLYFAITGQLSPVVAAILMPISSISVVVYGVVMSRLGKV